MGQNKGEEEVGSRRHRSRTTEGSSTQTQILYRKPQLSPPQTSIVLEGDQALCKRVSSSSIWL